MTTTIANKTENGYEWIDIEDPQDDELQKIAQQYGLHELSIADSLETDHLPKYEKLNNYVFVILRFSTMAENEEADSMKEITNRIAVFIGPEIIITIHRHNWGVVDTINTALVKKGQCKQPISILHELTRGALLSFDQPAQRITTKIERFEELLLIRKRRLPESKGLYYLKRKADVLRRVLLLTHDLIEHIDPRDNSSAVTRDIRDLYIKQQSVFDTVSDNINQLIAIYFNISSQRTNEIIRVLTIFSVFFMPLTFIVGIYGMNFDFMPELHFKYGYAATLGVMLLVVVAIYVWFKRRHWL